MPTPEARMLNRGLNDLLEASLAQVEAANRRQLDPLMDILRTAGRTGNDKIDLKALEKRLVKAIGTMDDSAVVDWAERVLMQTYAIGRTSAVPEGLEQALTEERDGLDE